MQLTADIGDTTRDSTVLSVGQDWFSPKRFSLYLCLLLFATYPEVICGTHSFFFRDFGAIAYPTVYYHRESFWRGELPLWNPLSHCGVPFLAQWGSMVLYPFSVFYLLLPLPWSLNFFCIAHLFLAGLGMYFLAHRWVGNRFAASVAGVVFVFNGVISSSLAWPNYTVALGWMPWVLLLVEQAWQHGGRRVITAALVCALQMLSGVPEIILLTWLLPVIFWATEFWRARPGRRRIFLRLVIVILIVSGLTAAQLLPFFALLAHSQRNVSFGTAEWAMPGWGWANFLVPLFHCAKSPQGIFYQPGHVFLISYYLGIGTVALAVLAVWRVRQVRVWLLLGCTIFSLIMALGDDGYLFTALKMALPELGFARFPIKFIYLALLTIPLLSAYAVDWLQTSPQAIGKRTQQDVLILWITLLVVVSTLVWFAERFKLPGDQWPITGQNAAVRALFLTLILGALFLLQRQERWQRQLVLRLAIVLLLWLDALTHVPHRHPTIRAEAFAAGLVRISPRPAAGESRAMISPSAEDRMYRSGVADFHDDFVGKRLGLWSNLHLLEGIPKVEGASTLLLREQAEVQALLYRHSDTDLPALTDFLGVSQITAPERIVEWVARSNYLPWVTIGQKAVFVESVSTLNLLTQPGFDARHLVYLPTEARSVVTATNRTDGKILNQNFRTHRIVVEVEASHPSMVVVAQTFYHPWKAYVDGHAIPLWRANHAFQALEVPAGRHHIKLVYEDRQFSCGSAISGVTLLACVGFSYLGSKRQAPRRQRD